MTKHKSKKICFFLIDIEKQKTNQTLMGYSDCQSDKNQSEH